MIDLGNVLTAMVTPFNDAGEIDFPRAAELAVNLVKNGSDGIVIAGTTGESATMGHAEKLDLFRCVIDAVRGKCSIIAGTGNNDTGDTCAFTAEASKLDLDAVMLVGPYYNKPSQEGLFQHFRAGAAATELPVIAYNVPGRTSMNINTETTVRLAEKIDNIVAVKEASGDMNQISEIIRLTPDDFVVYSGDDFITLPMLALGAKGIISVVSNVAGSLVQAMVTAFHAGNMAEAAKLHHKLFPLYKACFLPSGNPACVKRAMQISGWDPGAVRLPVVLASEADTARIREACETIGLADA